MHFIGISTILPQTSSPCPIMSPLRPPRMSFQHNQNQHMYLWTCTSDNPGSNQVQIPLGCDERLGSCLPSPQQPIPITLKQSSLHPTWSQIWPVPIHMCMILSVKINLQWSGKKYDEVTAKPWAEHRGHACTVPDLSTASHCNRLCKLPRHGPALVRPENQTIRRAQLVD